MTTKKRFERIYKLELREEDHNPMHVHLSGNDVDVVISLESLKITQGEAPKSLIKKVILWLFEHREELIREWKKWNK